MSLEWVGWSGLTPNEQFTAACGAAIGSAAVMARRALFGFGPKRTPAKRKRQRKKAKRKGRR
jgi:hypothetical protein